jgi:hypothetical protein
VDRRAPEGGGALTPLTNYVDVPWADGVAWNYAAIRPTTYRLGQSPSNATLENFTMLDDDGKPISAATIETTTFCGSKILDHPAAAAASRLLRNSTKPRHALASPQPQPIASA